VAEADTLRRVTDERTLGAEELPSYVGRIGVESGHLL
jgi:hypothetical protein